MIIANLVYEIARHVIGLRAMDSLPLEYWFGQCFAGYIAETSLVRYNLKIMLYVMLSTHNL